MSTLELVQAILRTVGWSALALTATYVWARPARCGMNAKASMALAARARRWALLAMFGACTQFGRSIGIRSEFLDLTSTITVFAVVATGFVALEGRRS